MELEWCKCMGGVWCELSRIDESHEHLDYMNGVYVLWHGEKEKTVIKVGIGEIRKEIIASRKDKAVLAFLNYGIKITWADVSSLKRKGVHAYLTKELSPRIPNDSGKTITLECNLPFTVPKKKAEE